jgi:Predicted aminopeptidases
MIKKLLSFFLVIFCTLLSFSFQLYFSVHSFNDNSVKKYIDHLSSDSLKGRLAGTVENDITALYVKNQFENNGLKPYQESYFQQFDTVYPHKIEGNPYLTVTDQKGFLIKEYKYGVDYKEDLLNFKKNNISFNNHDRINFGGEHLQIQKDNNYFLFYLPGNNKLNFRSSFIHTSPYSMYVMATKATIEELQSYLKDNYVINCFIPFEAKQTSINNVTAYIEGKDLSAPPMVLSAHFDHIGTDLSGNVYSGALDNASGTAFVLEMSKYIKSLGKPDRSIIFVGFNAEEFGCLGSKAFVDKYINNLKGSKVLNFDMIGTNNSVPLYIMGGRKDTKNASLIKETSSICLKNKIDFNYLFEDASDHEYFRKQNIDAITLSDSDTTRIHTPNDKPTFIDSNNIDRCFKIASTEVIRYGFGDNLLLLYYKEVFFISLIGVVICSKLKRG